MATDKSKRCGEAFVEATLRDKITGPLRKLSEKVRATGVALSVAADVDAVVRSVGSDMFGKINATFAELMRQMDAELKQLAADADVGFDDMAAEWEERHGEPYPRTIDELKKLAARAGISGERIIAGDWSPGGVEPVIEGYLLGQKDKRAGEFTPSTVAESCSKTDENPRGHGDTSGDKWKNTKEIPLPTTAGYPKFHNAVMDAKSKGEEVNLRELDRQITTDQGLATGSLTRAHRRYMKRKAEVEK